MEPDSDRSAGSPGAPSGIALARLAGAFAAGALAGGLAVFLLASPPPPALPVAPAVTQPAWQRTDTGAAQVQGMTPNPDARGWRIQGLKPEGTSGAQPLTVDAWHFSHGLTVFQALIWQGGDPLPHQNGEDAVEVFRQSLHFPG